MIPRATYHPVFSDFVNGSFEDVDPFPRRKPYSKFSHLGAHEVTVSRHFFGPRHGLSTTRVIFIHAFGLASEVTGDTKGCKQYKSKPDELPLDETHGHCNHGTEAGGKHNKDPIRLHQTVILLLERIVLSAQVQNHVTAVPRPVELVSDHDSVYKQLEPLASLFARKKLAVECINLLSRLLLRGVTQLVPLVRVSVAEWSTVTCISAVPTEETPRTTNLWLSGTH